MVDASLLEFFQVGRLGPLALGLDWREVRQLAGEPENFRLEAGGEPVIYKYGDIELIFAGPDRTVSLIDLHDLDGVPSGGQRVHLDPWIIGQGLSRAACEAALGQAGVQFRPTDWTQKPWGDDGTVRLWCGVGVELIFQEEREECGPPLGFHGAFLSERAA